MVDRQVRALPPLQPRDERAAGADGGANAASTLPSMVRSPESDRADDAVSTDHAMHRAILLSLATGVLVPLVGILNAPILAQAVGAAGRGEVAAAIAPNTLIVSAATLGLPEALTWMTATRSAKVRRSLFVAAGLTAVLAVICVVIVLVALPFLSDGDEQLATLIVIGAVLAPPMLIINLMHAISVGQQWWYRLAAEKIVSAALRLVILLILLAFGQLNVLNAVLVLTVVPILAGLVHLAVLRPDKTAATVEVGHAGVTRQLVSYGSRSWIGAVAGVLLAKLGMILFIPLSNATELGLYVVGVTISDVPIILALALREALFGVSARDRDAQRFASASRTAVAAAIAGTAVLGLSLPLWMGPVFGEEFIAAIPSAWILMGCSIVNVPTFLLAAGLSAWGRPGRRSVGIALTVVVDVVLFVLLVPQHGAVGAASANLVSATFGAIFSIEMARRTLGVRRRDLVIVRRTDLVRGFTSTVGLLRRRRTQ